MADTWKRPEGELLTQLRRSYKGRPSMREAAHLVGMSEARWRQIENGYATPTKGTQVPVVAPASTLAVMVEMLNGTADDLRRASRADAAEEVDAHHRHIGAMRREQEERGQVEDQLRRIHDEDLLKEIARRFARRGGDDGQESAATSRAGVSPATVDPFKAPKSALRDAANTVPE